MTCWWYGSEKWESVPVKRTVHTDAEGYFELTFDRGEAIDIIVRADNHPELRLSETLRKNKIHLTLMMD